MSIKVVGGTPRHDESLCKTCRNAFLAKGHAVSQEIVICGASPKSFPVTFPIHQCSDYDDKRIPSKYEMEKIACMVVTKGDGDRKIGFVSPKEYKEIKKKSGDDDD